MRKILCMLGYHKWAWYSEYDLQLFKKGQTTGPLTECRICGCHKRIEDGYNDYVNAKAIVNILTEEERKQNEEKFIKGIKK